MQSELARRMIVLSDEDLDKAAACCVMPLTYISLPYFNMDGVFTLLQIGVTLQSIQHFTMIISDVKCSGDTNITFLCRPVDY